MHSDTPSPEPDWADAALADRLAALDDCLSGHASADGPALTEGLPDDLADPAVADAIDAILLLRQTAAADTLEPQGAADLPLEIGRFQIVREAGRGGFAFVAEAIDPMLCRRVGLKVARPEALLSGDIRRRFIREAEIAARLVHPHIVSIHEVGEADGLVFIAQEYCAGGSLADWLEQHPGPMQPVTAARLVLALAQAVAHAHSHAIIHRDIKPANVLLVPVNPASGEPTLLPEGSLSVKLCDFGLAKLFDAADPLAHDLTQLTQTGVRLGTPAWMAPEQIDASFGAVGPATDIHALGLLLDRLLTGRCPRAGRTDAETFRQVLLEEPVAADRVARDVPRDLGAVCLKCLAKKPLDRYATAAELAAELARYLDGRPTLARPLSPLAKAARGVRRRPLVSGLVAAVIGTILLAGWSATERAREIERRSAGQEEIRRHEATAELRRGFDAWRTGNVSGALGHLDACAAIDPGLAGSIAGHWLRRRTHGERAILLQSKRSTAGAPEAIHAIAVAPDGRSAAAGTDAGTLFIVPLATTGAAPLPPVSVAAHDEINDVVFSPDGTQIATVGQDGRVRLWTAAEGAPLGPPADARCPLYAVAYSADGRTVFYGGEDRIVRVVQAEALSRGAAAPQVFHECQLPQPNDVDIEALCRIGEDMLAVAVGKSIQLLDARDGRLLKTFDGLYRSVASIAASPDGLQLCCVGHDPNPAIWSLPDGSPLRVLPRHPAWVQGCGFAADGRQVVTGCKDGVARVFDLADGTLRQRLVGHAGRVWDAAFAQGGMILTAGADGSLRRWDLTRSAEAAGLETRALGEGAVRSTIALPRDDRGARILVAQWQRPLTSIEAATGHSIPAPDSPFEMPFDSAYDAPRRRLAIGQEKGPVCIAALEAGAVGRLEPLPGSEGLSNHGLAWTTGGMLVVGCTDGRVMVWDADLARGVEIDRHDTAIDAVSVCPADGLRVAAGGRKRVTIYRLEPPRTAGGRVVGKAILTLRSLPADVHALAWSPDGKRIACGANGGFVLLFDTATGERVGSLSAHERDLLGVAYSPDGRTLITADAETVRFSDAVTLALFDELRPGWRIHSMSLANDGNTIAVGGEAPTPLDVMPAGLGRLGIIDVSPWPQGGAP